MHPAVPCPTPAPPHTQEGLGPADSVHGPAGGTGDTAETGPCKTTPVTWWANKACVVFRTQASFPTSKELFISVSASRVLTKLRPSWLSPG